MQHIINLAEGLLKQGRELWEQDRYDEATGALTRLLGLKGIPTDIAERAQFYLGDMHLAQGYYQKARRHLTAALATGTGTGEVHFLMACALDWEDHSNLQQAYRHYRRAAELDPGQPLYVSAYAMTRLRRNGTKARADRKSLQLLRQAFAAAPDDPDVVYNYVSGLLEMNRYKELELPLQRARKQWPGHPAFEELWFELLGQRGIAPRTIKIQRRENERPDHDKDPVILRFPAPPRKRLANKSLRPNARLKSALQVLTAKEIGEIGTKLGLNIDGNMAAQRDRIRDTLADDISLRTLVSHLSVRAKKLFQTIVNAGGKLESTRFEVRKDGKTGHQPHVVGRLSVRPIDELRQMGLVYYANPTAGPSKVQLAIVPSDMRRTVRGILAKLQN